MRPIENIRRNVFKASQAELARFAGTTQASVSRWEGGLQEPSREEMANIRAKAHERGLRWDDRWFFEVVEIHQPEATQ